MSKITEHAPKILMISYLLTAVALFGPIAVEAEQDAEARYQRCRREATSPERCFRLGAGELNLAKALFWPLWLSYRVAKALFWPLWLSYRVAKGASNG